MFCLAVDLLKADIGAMGISDRLSAHNSDTTAAL